MLKSASAEQKKAHRISRTETVKQDDSHKNKTNKNFIVAFVNRREKKRFTTLLIKNQMRTHESLLTLTRQLWQLQAHSLCSINFIIICHTATLPFFAFAVCAGVCVCREIYSFICVSKLQQKNKKK